MIERYQQTVITEEIDGITYSSSKFPCTKSLQLMSRTVKVLGEAGLQAVVMVRGAALLQALPRLLGNTQPRIYQAAVAIAYGLGEDINLPRDLCANLKASALRPSGKGGSVSEHFDTHFQGELPHLIRVLQFVLAHTFAGFTLGSPSMSGSPTSDETSTDASSDSPSQNEESASDTSTG